MARLQVGFIPIEGGHYYREALEEVTRAEELGFFEATRLAECLDVSLHRVTETLKAAERKRDVIDRNAAHCGTSADDGLLSDGVRAAPQIPAGWLRHR